MTNESSPRKFSGPQLSPLELEVANLIVSLLQLEIRPEDIAPEEALFGEGLGLDSIDALELALEINKRYGLEIHADDSNNIEIFASLRRLADHIGRNRVE